MTASNNVPEPFGREPRDVGPIAGGNLRASDADREQVANLLGTAFAEGRLTHEEYDERLEQAMSARTFDDLVPITSDLVPVTPPTLPQPQPQAQSNFTIDQSHPAEERDTMIAIFGGASRKGKWRIRKSSTAIAVFGGVELDLRDAVFEAPVVEIIGFWCFGGMDVLVPEGVEVRDQTAGVFGGTDITRLGDPVPGAPVIVLKGMSLFGGVSVKGPKKRR
ncbi:DUF1707 SHOCT-like domain-containing protein [Microlunatus parietis]|uniref:DUF1707 domain-containing protein n=1 Tax=Microlunatus parietis TaxID=682979 RepID=A0A7Y9I9N3_9ACTN|nr:DUF1707 domain-containing protein [Microlunatus parietis]NYE72593.1 hypothetical protein [Microlunatus parietis]